MWSIPLNRKSMVSALQIAVVVVLAVIASADSPSTPNLTPGPTMMRQHPHHDRGTLGPGETYPPHGGRHSRPPLAPGETWRPRPPLPPGETNQPMRQDNQGPPRPDGNQNAWNPWTRPPIIYDAAASSVSVSPPAPNKENVVAIIANIVAAVCGGVALLISIAVLVNYILNRRRMKAVAIGHAGDFAELETVPPTEP